MQLAMACLAAAAAAWLHCVSMSMCRVTIFRSLFCTYSSAAAAAAPVDNGPNTKGKMHLLRFLFFLQTISIAFCVTSAAACRPQQQPKKWSFSSETVAYLLLLLLLLLYLFGCWSFCLVSLSRSLLATPHITFCLSL